ncbi:MAG TPA: beta-ketoacyl-ACP synthase III [Planctomycetota bacterium]|nr:beta-ketoacyl-ACP synthase III [Planctomycetota bacterium]
MSAVLQSAIYGTGAYVPKKVLPNEYFAKTLDTSDEWITTRTGIRRRHIAADDQATSDLCLHAAKAALDDSKVPAGELDLILVGTITPDYEFPSTACLLQDKLGLSHTHIGAFDLSAACSGFGYGLATAQAYIGSGMAKRVLVVGAEILSRLLDWSDRTTCILFGDGAGAAVVGPARNDGASHTILSTRMHADGSRAMLLSVPAGGSARPTSAATVAEKMHYLRMGGREVFRFGVTAVIDMLSDVMERHKLSVEDIGAIIPHQANIRIIESAIERLKIPMDLFVMNLHEYGNTSAASIPMALDEASRAGRLTKGKYVILVAFGAGLTWSSTVLQW